MTSNEEKKMYLEKYLELRFETDQLFDEAEYWHEKAYTISALKLNSLGIHGNSKKDQPIEMFWNIYSKLKRQAKYAFKQQMEIREAINRMNKPLHRTILKLRYVEGYRVKDIAYKLNYSVDYLYNLFEKAIRNFEIPSKIQKDVRK